MTSLVVSPSTSNNFTSINIKTTPSRNAKYIDSIVLLGHSYDFTPNMSVQNFFGTYNSVNATESEYDIICKKIASFASLENDWDGYGGVAPSMQLVDFSMYFLSFLDSLFILPSVTLSGAGNISFYWKNSYDKSYIEIELDSVGYYNYLVKSSDDIYGEEDVDFDKFSIVHSLKYGLTDYLRYPIQKIVA